MSQWTDQTPGQGDTGAVSRDAFRLYDHAANMIALRDLVTEKAALVTPATWNGEAGRAFVERATTLSTDLGTFAQSLSGYHDALSTYSSALATIAAEATSLAHQHDRASSTQARAREQLRSGRVRPHGPMLSPAQRDDAQRDAESAGYSLRRVNNDLAALAERRRNADTTLRGVLDQHPTNRFVRTGGILVASGLPPRAELLTPGALSEAATSLADLVETGDATDQQIDEFAAVLALIAHTPDAAGKFLQNIGGEQLATIMRALDELAVRDPDPLAGAINALGLLRTSLASASVLWDQDEAEDFADRLVDVDGEGNPLVLSYLFGDAEGAPMGEALTFAVAQAILDWEAQNGRELTSIVTTIPPDPHLGHTVTTLDYHGGRTPGNYYHDAANDVSAHMARYPEASISWFADPEHRTERTNNWFGRDWLDGFTASSALVEAMNTTEGAWPGGTYDPGLAEALAEVNTRILPALIDNARSDGTSLSDSARTSLAKVLDLQLAAWLTTSIAASGTVQGMNNFSNDEIPWTGEARWSNHLRFDEITWLIGEVSRSEVAATRLAETTRRLTEEIFDGVGSGHLSTTSAAEYVSSLLGAITGARFMTELADADISDERGKLALEIATLPLDFVGESPAGGFAAGLFFDQAKDRVAPLIFDAHDTAVSNYFNGTGNVADRYDAARSTISDLIKTHDPAHFDSLTGLEMDTIMDEYAKNVGSCVGLDLRNP